MHAQAGAEQQAPGGSHWYFQSVVDAKFMDAAPIAVLEEVPRSYRRVVAAKAGESVRAVATVRDERTVEPGTGEVLLQVVTAGINGGCETFRARAEFAYSNLRRASNYPLGSEGSAVVLRAGPGTDLKPGDAVAFVDRAFSELNLVKAGSCYRFGRAADLKVEDFRQATALRISGLVALVGLELTGDVKRGETVLVTAAAGGTGHFAVQIAKLNGARVIATCGSDEKAKLLRELGADRVVVYKREDLSKVLDTEFPEGLDLVYEGVGGELHKTALAHLKKGGRQVQVGYISHYPQAAGVDASPGLGESLGDGFWSGATEELAGGRTLYFNAWGGMKKAYGLPEKPIDRLFALWRSGNIKAVVDPKPFIGLEEAGDAVEYMMSGKSAGKVVLDIPRAATAPPENRALV